MTATIALPEKDQEHERILGVIFDLSPAQAATLSCLARVALIDGDRLLEFTGNAPPIKVAVSRTREKLRLHDMDIESKLGVGYWISPEHRAIIEGMVEKFVNG